MHLNELIAIISFLKTNKGRAVAPLDLPLEITCLKLLRRTRDVYVYKMLAVAEEW